MNAPDARDCEHTDELVCPYCGQEQSDSWEYSGDVGEVDCGHCSRRFTYWRDVSVSYSTQPIIGPHSLSGPYLRDDQEEP